MALKVWFGHSVERMRSNLQGSSWSQGRRGAGAWAGWALQLQPGSAGKSLPAKKIPPKRLRRNLRESTQISMTNN